MSAAESSEADELHCPLIAGHRPPPFNPTTPMALRIARLIGKLNGAPVTYRYWHGREPRCALSGRGSFVVEHAEGKLHCRVRGDLFKPTPFEFSFHHFWLTRRAIIGAVFDLADSRSPDQHGASETFIHFELGSDRSLRREADAFHRRFAGTGMRRATP